MNRKLQHCKICKEWFNTTDEIIKLHYAKHPLTVNIKCDASEFIKILQDAMLRCYKGAKNANAINIINTDMI